MLWGFLSNAQELAFSPPFLPSPHIVHQCAQLGVSVLNKSVRGISVVASI